MTAGVSASSQQQSAGIEQVNIAITQMDDVTQQNAALVEQAAAAESMEEQARNLAQAVAIFKLTGNIAGGAGQALERSENAANVARLAKREKGPMRRPAGARHGRGSQRAPADTTKYFETGDMKP